MFDSSRFLGFLKNRYELLEEVQSFLEFNGVDLGQVFEVLLNSSDGCVIYNFGGVQIQFMRGFGVWSGSQSAVQLFIELDNDKVKETAEYELELRDLKLLRRKRFLENLHGEAEWLKI